MDTKTQFSLSGMKTNNSFCSCQSLLSLLYFRQKKHDTTKVYLNFIIMMFNSYSVSSCIMEVTDKKLEEANFFFF